MRYHTSPERFNFTKNNKEKSSFLTPEQRKEWSNYIEQYRINDGTPNTSKPCLEHDLRYSEVVANKCKNSDSYSQNLYAALCNNDFSSNGTDWHCSWRHAGGIVANLREEGDYIDWYCSGIEFNQKSLYVEEGFITEEILKDIENLGWKVGKTT